VPSLGAAGLQANAGRSLQQGLVGQGTEEQDRIEDVGLPDCVGAGDAGEGAESQIQIDDVLEATGLRRYLWVEVSTQVALL
jgi:hypothetical protein